MGQNQLLESMQVGRTLRLKSRIVLAPLYYEWEFGSRAFMNFFKSRAAGGVALAMVPVPTHGGLTDLEKPSFAEKSRKFIDMMRGYDCKVVPQLFSGNGEEVNQQSTGQLEVLPAAFARAARVLCELGYDGVDIHGAHHSLFMSLLSPIINQRTDQFGGDEQNRFRLPLATVSAVRLAAPDFPLFYRFSAVDYVAGGFDIETAVRFAVALEAAGATCIDVSAGGTILSPQYSDAPLDAAGEGCFAELSAAIKKHVRIPVVVAGRINSKATAEQIIHGGMADAVAIGRLLVKNAKWPNEIAAAEAAPVS
jgi:2,4-dienoyl-CoA reductase-like NADH-dependent reductase (Old Yellow Enzyme family)